MDGEGDGPQGPFFPSSAQTTDGRKIPAEFFMKSEACQRCHADIYKQWNSSAHHFSSFNNQWYRASIEYMQDVVGTKPSKWCGGCHDPAVLFSGLMDTPIRQIVDRPEAHAGLGCMMCHSIVQV
jgi:formate-dependent nitrite reductase cytochrome c552 subunit